MSFSELCCAFLYPSFKPLDESHILDEINISSKHIVNADERQAFIISANKRWEYNKRIYKYEFHKEACPPYARTLCEREIYKIRDDVKHFQRDHPGSFPKEQ
jgi:hypothetical protein